MAKRLKVKSGKPVSKAKVKNKGTYQVQATLQNPHSRSYVDVETIVHDAESPADAMAQGSKRFNSNFTVVRIVAIFLGVLLLFIVPILLTIAISNGV